MSVGTATEKLFKPHSNLLMFVGCYNPLLYKIRRHKGDISRDDFVLGLHLFYCTSVVSVMWFELLRYSYQITDEIQNGLTFDLTAILCGGITFLAMALHTTTSLWTFSGEMRKTVDLWRKYELEYGIGFDVVRVKQWVVRIHICLFIYIVSMSTTVPFFLSEQVEESLAAQTFLSFELIGIPSKTKSFVWIFLSMSLALSWIILLGIWTLYVLLGYFVWKEASVIRESLRQYNSFQPEASIRTTRFKFEKLVQLLYQCNGCIYHTPAISLTMNVTIVCLNLYGIVQGTLSYNDMLYAASSAIIMILQAAILIGIGTLVNEGMHSPLEALYGLDIQQMSEKEAIEVSLFAGRLRGQPLGITVYGFFVIERSTVLMLLGTFLTYFVVLIQMKPTGNDTCNLQMVMDLLNATKCE